MILTAPLLAVLAAATPAALDARLSHALDEGFALGATPGITVAVVKGDATVFTKALGLADVASKRPARTDTLFYIGSTTKALTATAAAALAAKGAIDLDAPVSRYLPALELQPPLDPARISLRDLLTLTHGISADGPVDFRTAFTGDTTEPLLMKLAKAHPPSPKGREFVYGNLGYVLGGLALGAGVDGGWRRVIEREVLGPVGMKDTISLVSKLPASRTALSYEMGPDGFQRATLEKVDATMHPAGGHFSTPHDLALFLRAHMNAGRVAGKPVLAPRAIAETHRKQADQKKTWSEIDRFGWGLGWDLGRWEGKLLLHRFGSYPGWRSHVSFLPAEGVGVIVLVNGGDVSSLLSDLVAFSLYDEVLGREDAAERREKRLKAFAERLAKHRERLAASARERAARAPLARPLPAYAGDYENADWGRMTVTAKDGALAVTMGAARSAAEPYDAAADEVRLTLTGPGTVAKFVFPEGAEKASAIRWDGREYPRVAAR
jgi:CubicO group peptidase (beta-lactamase class C family)